VIGLCRLVKFEPSPLKYAADDVPSVLILPFTSKPVPFISFKSVLVSLDTITFEPSFLTAYSIIPSSVVSLASEIFPVILA
jgi:hypothetical protein